MAHFAQLDKNNLVIQVIVVNNNECKDTDGNESEAVGVAFCQSLFPETIWKQTSYNGNIRKNYAGVGYTYDANIDAFVPPKPYASWVLNDAAQWEAPVAMPDDGQMYSWDENAQTWAKVEEAAV